MTINRIGTAPTARAGAARPTKAPGGPGFRIDVEETKPASGASPAAPVAPLSGLLGLQEVGDQPGQRRRAVRRASDLLDMLEAIRLDLLDGHVGEDRLSALLKLVSTQRDTVSDPRLAHVLDEIELRARVELAKLERNR